MNDPNPIPPGGISPWVISHIRTAVPGIVAVAVTYTDHELARRYGWAPPIDTATVGSGVVFGLSYGYYVLVRRLERWKPKLGWLLGYPAQPKY